MIARCYSHAHGIVGISRPPVTCPDLHRPVPTSHRPDLQWFGFFSIEFQGIACNGFTFFVQLWCTEIKGPVFVTMFDPVAAIMAAMLAYFIFGENLYVGMYVFILFSERERGIIRGGLDSNLIQFWAKNLRVLLGYKETTRAMKRATSRYNMHGDNPQTNWLLFLFCIRTMFMFNTTSILRYMMFMTT